uniref:Zinc finger protein 346 n=1 Tax=Poecilia reticulata TaxID=8081 RepID=A0A3P9NG12_POERE
MLFLFFGGVIRGSLLMRHQRRSGGLCKSKSRFVLDECENSSRAAVGVLFPDDLSSASVALRPAVDKMIRERGDLFSDTQCKVCSAVLISQSQKLTHYQSKKHANKVRRFLSLENENGDPVKKPKTSDDDCNNGDTDRLKACHLCNMTFTSPVMAESHYQGKFHAKRLKMKAVESQTPEASQISQPAEKPADNPAGGSETDNNNNPDRFCSTCKASFNNPLMAQQHYAGKKHKKHMTRLKLMETYGPSTAPGQTAARFWFPSFVLCRLTALILVAYCK